jgi:hypothetical protein
MDAPSSCSPHPARGDSRRRRRRPKRAKPKARQPKQAQEAAGPAAEEASQARARHPSAKEFFFYTYSIYKPSR